MIHKTPSYEVEGNTGVKNLKLQLLLSYVPFYIGKLEQRVKILANKNCEKTKQKVRWYLTYQDSLYTACQLRCWVSSRRFSRTSVSCRRLGALAMAGTPDWNTWARTPATRDHLSGFALKYTSYYVLLRSCNKQMRWWDEELFQLRGFKFNLYR